MEIAQRVLTVTFARPTRHKCHTSRATRGISHSDSVSVDISNIHGELRAQPDYGRSVFDIFGGDNPGAP